jgi:cytoplasmic iron level regulating protein YaaA (DUF328/UPF0246 family)
MKMIISPAKTLDFERELPVDLHTKAAFLKESKVLIAALKKLSPDDLSQLMDISPKLAELNWQRNREWKTPFTTDNARAAIYAFNGDVYVGLDAYTIAEDKIDDMQKRLRILSGLYGLLKPLDLIRPYRLEMGTKLKTESHADLYAFWREKITAALNKELKKGEVLVNLASKEYFDVIDKKVLKARIVTPEFRDYTNGKLKIVSFFAKKARGMMVRYIIDNNITTVEGLKGFTTDGYVYDDNLSKGDTLVFTR